MYKERSFNSGPRGGGFAPVKVGQELDVKIEAVGQKGDGIAKEKGFVLFIPGAKENDEVRVRVTKVLRNVGFAEVVGKATGQPSATEQPKEETQDSEEFGETEEKSEESSNEPEADSDSAEDSENFGDEEQQQ